MLAITTFPPAALQGYAKVTLPRMAKLWPGSVRAYFEGTTPPALDGIEFRSLDVIPERREFLERDIPKKKGFLWDAKRFCHKVFAQLDAAKDGEPFWWVDADVLLLDKIPKEMLEQYELVTFLGRNSYTETGLIGFNPQHPEWQWFEDRYRSMYTEGTITSLPHWTDCHAFDWARAGKGMNLTPYGHGFKNVMDTSEFGPYMSHFKGIRKWNLQPGGVYA